MVYGYSAVCVRIDLTTSTIKKKSYQMTFYEPILVGMALSPKFYGMK